MRNKRTLLAIILLMTAVFIGECCAANPKLVPAPNSSERISSLGLSILPPKGDGWYVLTDNPNGGLNFTKMIDDKSHTISCTLTVVPIENKFSDLDKFLAFVKQAQETYTDKNRFKDINSNYNPNNRFGAFSVEYKITVTDIWRKRKGTPLTMKMYGYTFVHPKNPNYIVDIVYSERGVAKDFTPALYSIGEEFINNLIVEK